jgi:fructose-bisphosphate aldolase, class II
LYSVSKAVGDRVRLVLHGADPFDDKIFKRCIKAGVTKININKGVNKHYEQVQHNMHGKPLTEVIEAGTLAMQKAIEKYMACFGSAGKARPDNVS